MRPYMNLVVLALATCTVSPALSAPTSYGYGNLAVHDSRGVQPKVVHSNDGPSPSPSPAPAPAPTPDDPDGIHEVLRDPSGEDTPSAPGAAPPLTYPPPPASLRPAPPAPVSPVKSPGTDPRIHFDPTAPASGESRARYPPGRPAPPASSAPAPSAPASLVGINRAKVALIGSTAAVLGVGGGVAAYGAIHNQNQNQTRRTSEAFEGRANAELVERALGDHDLDKRFGLSTFFRRTLGTLAGSSATSAGVSRDVSHSREVVAAWSALGKREIAPGDRIAAPHLFSRLLDELD